MDQKNQLQESDFLKQVEKWQEILDKYPKNGEKNKIYTVLLVGETGSGKSTIFNFLSGANFQINNKSLEITNNSASISYMDNGMKSVTNTPNFYKNNKNNHLIIDFPAFQSIYGTFNQLLIDLLLNKIITSGPIKLIYILNNPESTLPYRGSNLYQFIEQLNNPKFDLLLNCYLEDLSDKDLIYEIKNELDYMNLAKSIDKILVLRKASKCSLDKIFNDNQRKTLWSQIEQLKENIIQPQQLPKSKEISQYIINSSLQTIDEYLVRICENFIKKCNNLTENNAEDILKYLQELLDFSKKENNETMLQWYLKFITICEKIAQNLEINKDIINASKNFIKIFKYFEQFSSLISGYHNLSFIKIIAKSKIKIMEEFFNIWKECRKKSQLDANKTQVEVKLFIDQQFNFLNKLEQLYNDSMKFCKKP